MNPKRARPEKLSGVQSSPQQADGRPLRPADFEGVLEKLKLLQFGLFGLQQWGREAPLDVEDIGPFTRLAEEIESDLLLLQQRLPPPETRGPSA